MLCVTPDDDPGGEDAGYDDLPVYAVTLSYRKADKPGHRDILGAIMGLGIERDTVGDIFIGEGAAAVFCTKTASELIRDQLTSVGRIGVSVSDGLNESSAAAVKPAACADITVNIASVRTDCIVSGITGLSREKAAAFIRSGSVLLNYEECDSVSRTVSEGDCLTLRGYGKFIVSGDQTNTKKGRIRLILKKYI
jgi:RNA-binding protein YlmH